MLADPTTGLSKAIDDSVADAMVYGSSMVKISNGGNDSATITAGPYVTHLGSSATIGAIRQNFYPPRARLKKTDLEEHPAFELTVEQLRAAWILAYGTRWVSMDKPMNDDYLNVVTHRLMAFGELETIDVVDQWIPMGRVKT